jgi:tRNA (guanine37-N1)-methyltransferase
MVMLPEPLCRAVEAAEAQGRRALGASCVPRRVLMTPQGARLDQARVRALAASPWLVILCGHYEGIDQRAIDALAPEEISIGDYVLSGGELAAMVVLDAVARVLPGALGDDQSAARDSFEPVPTTDGVGTPLTRRDWRELGWPDGHPPEAARLLDCPHYTRPREWRGRAAPDVLFTGDHRAVARWRVERMLEATRARRPDLLGPQTTSIGGA